ncbi:MAG: hypothetical protein JWN04_5174 [Myxococcaceae bacterium]|nr:hypothetical protein [Myxococcaceae bacterium]
MALHFTRGEGAQSCIDPVTLARRVEALTGPVLRAPSDADASVEAHVEGKPGGGFRARIRLAAPGDPPHGERVLEDDALDCRSFDAALAFVIATTIDPDLAVERVGALFRPGEQSPGQRLLSELTLAKPLVPANEPLAAPPASKAPAPLVPTRVLPQPVPIIVGIGLLGSSELPKAALGGGVDLRVRLWPWLELGLGMRGISAVKSVSVRHGKSARTQLFAAALLACPRLPLRSGASVGACAGPETSLLRAKGVGFDPNHAGLLSGWAAHMRAEATLPSYRSYDLTVAAYGRWQPRHLRLTSERANGSDEFFATKKAAFGAELSVRRTF